MAAMAPIFAPAVNRSGHMPCSALLLFTVPVSQFESQVWAGKVKFSEKVPDIPEGLRLFRLDKTNLTEIFSTPCFQKKIQH